MTETAKDKTVTTYTLDFAYDAQGTPYSLTVTMKGVSLTYYYITNLQGDVMYLIDASKNVVVSYDYDPYGKIISVVDSTANASSLAGEGGADDVQPYAQIPTEPEDTTKTLADINPLRYRGYYYDTDDVGFYYLQSRYYDADTCRFISADSVDYIGITGSNLSYNTFAYCENNPVAAKDDGGEFWHLAIGAVVGAAIGAVSSVVTQVVDQLSEGKSLGEVKINGGEVATAAVTGAVSGGLAASGLGLGIQVVGNAVVSMAGNVRNQVAKNKGFNGFDLGDMLLDGAIGAVAGLAGGSGAGNKGLTRLGKQSLKRAGSALKHKGVRVAVKEFVKGMAYYGKNAKHIVKPLVGAFVKSGTAALTGGVSKAILY